MVPVEQLLAAEVGQRLPRVGAVGVALPLDKVLPAALVDAVGDDAFHLVLLGGLLRRRPLGAGRGAGRRGGGELDEGARGVAALGEALDDLLDAVGEEGGELLDVGEEKAHVDQGGDGEVEGCRGVIDYQR